MSTRALSPLAQAFSDWARRLHLRLGGAAGAPAELVQLGAAAACARLDEGHSCASLPLLAGRPLLDSTDEADGDPARWPALDAWLDALSHSPLVGDGSSPTPLLLDEADRLYLYRYWRYEQLLATHIATRARLAQPIDRPALMRDLDRHFQTPARVLAASEGVDWQRQAALVAAQRSLTVVTGGPGTGKTTTVVRLLAILIEQALALGQTPPRIALLAPTGKAAARMGEAVKSGRQQLDCTDAVKEAIPDQGATIHRALGWRPRTPSRFRHDADHPMAVDVVVVDEASMVPLHLMARLVDAVPERARLILLGDRDQLASVEPGAVLGELCASPTLADAVVALRYSYRNVHHPDIGTLARAVNRGDPRAALTVLDAPEHPDVSRVSASTPGGARRALRAALEQLTRSHLQAYLSAETPLDAFRALDAFRVLCVHRGGPLGVHSLNAMIAQILEAQGLDRTGVFYSHRPIIITENDHNLKLYNGDVGVVLPVSPGSPELRVFFLGRDGEPRPVSTGRLPPHETAFALTVHKSQGSEFQRVLLVLPQRPGPLLTRELLYTGVTRARQRVQVFASDEVLRHAIAHPTQRQSGLLDALSRA